RWAGRPVDRRRARRGTAARLPAFRARYGPGQCAGATVLFPPGPACQGPAFLPAALSAAPRTATAPILLFLTGDLHEHPAFVLLDTFPRSLQGLGRDQEGAGKEHPGQGLDRTGMAAHVADQRL